MSLLESGRRRPTDAALAVLAERLGCTVDYLVHGQDPADLDRVRLALSYAELALRNGEPGDALTQLDAVAGDLAAVSDSERWRHRRLRASTLESLGRLEQAIRELEELRAESGAAGRYGEQLQLTVDVVRCYKEVGDVAYALDVGEQTLASVRRLGLTGSDQHAELASTVLGLYFERGDLVRAESVATEVLEALGEGGSPRGRAAVHWNASLVAERRDDLPSALALAERALAVYAEGDDVRALARLRTAYAWLLLRSLPPRAAEARELLGAAREALLDVGSEIDVAYSETELARAELVLGRPAEALVAGRRGPAAARRRAPARDRPHDAGPGPRAAGPGPQGRGRCGLPRRGGRRWPGYGWPATPPRPGASSPTRSPTWGCSRTRRWPTSRPSPTRGCGPRPTWPTPRGRTGHAAAERTDSAAGGRTGPSGQSSVPVVAAPPSAARPPRVRRRLRLRRGRRSADSPSPDAGAGAAAAVSRCSDVPPPRPPRPPRPPARSPRPPARPPWPPDPPPDRPRPSAGRRPVSPRSSTSSASRPARVRSARGSTPVTSARDVELLVEVVGGRVGLLGLAEAEVERLVDQRPPGHVVPVDEGDRDAGRAGAGGAADAVQVGLLVLGALVVDDVRDVLHVDAARRDVGRDEHVDLAVAEGAQRLLARALAEVAVDGAGGEAAVGQLVGDLLRGALGAAEHHRQPAALGLQDAGEHLDLVHRVRPEDVLLDGLDRRAVVVGVDRADVRGLRACTAGPAR